ncbi:hypothetical protein AAEX28_08775 [Lentisphaerota bacterium WC36G]|nr:hypothetical protein LJT99_11630 [Lentisphaerae bacterium WC36]
MFKIVLLLFATFGVLLLTGCETTEQERRGVSSIPQNRPASWEQINTRF